MSTLKKIKSLQKRPDGIFGSFMTRPVSHVFAFISFKLKMSPNFVSFLSFIFCLLGIITLAISQDFYYKIAFIILWWLGAIYDAADGDLARFLGTGNPFGAWFDSFLDRMKEFLIFSLLGYISFKNSGNEIFLLLGIGAVFVNVMSGYMSDTRKLFITEKRKPQVQLSKKYNLGMVDTRDFIVIIFSAFNKFEYPLYIYCSLFLLALCYQFLKFLLDYGITKKNK